MHTVWKGAISFGLVHIPVKMFTATEPKQISLRMIHEPCGTPVNYKKTCSTCDREAKNEEIIKGYEYEKGHFVLLEEDELQGITPKSAREIQILDFVDLKEIDPVYFQKSYFLAPGDTGANAYSLLRKAMQDTGKIGIAQVTIRSKSSLAALRIMDDCIVMETIFYPDEIRSTEQVPNLPKQAEVKDQELKMAQMLIEQLSTPFEPEKYTDEYRSELQQLIEKKIAGEEVKVAPQHEPSQVIDLMAALQASLKTAQDPKAKSTAAKPKAKPKPKTERKKKVTV